MLESRHRVRILAGFAGGEADPVFRGVEEILQLFLRRLCVDTPDLGEVGDAALAGIKEQGDALARRFPADFEYALQADTGVGKIVQIGVVAGDVIVAVLRKARDRRRTGTVRLRVSGT